MWWAAAAGAGMQQAGKLDDALTAKAIGHWGDKRQLRQQKKLQALAIEGQKELNTFNQGLALDMWNKTNYEAQRKHMEAAGFNPGLMMEAGGKSGMLSSPGGNTSQGQAPAEMSYGMAMQLGMQNRMQAAQIANLNANTEKTKAEAEKTKGVDTQNVQAQIDKTIQDTQNAKLQNEYQNYQNTIANVEAEIKQKTLDEAVNQIYIANQKLAGEAQSAMSEGQIKNNTADEVIKQAQQNTIEQQVRIGALQQGIKVDQQAIQVMAREIQQMNDNFRAEWRNWEQRERERWVKEKMAGISQQTADYQTGGLSQAKQITDIVTSIINATKK